MNRVRLLDDVLDDLVGGYAERALERCQEGIAVGDGVALALTALGRFWLGHFSLASSEALRAVQVAKDDEAVGLALAVAAFAYASDLAYPGPDPLPLAIALTTFTPAGQRQRDEAWWAPVRYLVREATLISARLDDATHLVDSEPRLGAEWATRPLSTMAGLTSVRTYTFAGRIHEATAVIADLRTNEPGGRMAAVLESVACLVSGNADGPVEPQRASPRTDATAHGERDFIERGVLLLQAYGAVATGDTGLAAALVLEAGGDEGLRACPLIDRALGLELLVAAALDHGDREAARGWAAGAAELAHHPITRPTVDRLLARLALADGDSAVAIQLLERSIVACRGQRRAIEVAEGEILLARCRIAEHDVATASRILRQLVLDADQSGHRAARRSATETLRAVRRRLPPIAGGRWTTLSDRESEVGHRIMAGEEIDEIAAAMFLSPHTVKIHVSRVLCAFGVATRIGLLAAAAPSLPPLALPSLTPRQHEIVEHVAHGASNAQIAHALDISERTVEKHIGDVFTRWRVGSRFGIARAWWAQRSPVRDQVALLD